MRWQIDVQGKADSTFRVVSYALALEASGRFSDVRITEIDERLLADEETEAESLEVESHVITFAIATSK